MKNILPTIAVAGSLLASCGHETANPLTTVSDAKYGIEHYDQITIAHYRDAFEQGMQAQTAHVAAIVADTAAPDFQNTIAAFDRSGDELMRTMLIFSALSGSNSTEEIRQLETEIYPRLSAHNDDLYMNRPLFVKVKEVYDNLKHLEETDTAALHRLVNHEQYSATKKIYREFEQAGAALAPEEQKKLREINLKLSELELKFSQNLLHETNSTFVFVENKDELEGLSDADIEAAAQMAKEQGKDGQYAFNMQRPSCYPVMQNCRNRELRRRVYEAYYGRGNQQNEWNNVKISEEIIALRIEKAKIFGYDTSAEMILKDRMAKNPSAVFAFLDAVWKPAVRKLNEEIADIRQEMKADGIDEEPQGWDIMYYQTKVKAKKYHIDERQVSEYFTTENVLKGIFHVASQLYGLNFKEITSEVPAYEPSAQAWLVTDSEGKDVAIFYSDYYPRDGKGAGAWMTEFRQQSYDAEGKRTIPIIVNVCNMTKPASGQPALQSFDNVLTMFHEFGHALHYMLHDVHYNAIYNCERDFVELPSQINEHWALHPDVLKVYARHYRTGEIIPDTLVAKIDACNKYGQGFATVEYLAASYVDMDLHTLTGIPENFDIMKFETAKLQGRGIPSQIYPRYRVTNFSHSIGGGYSAGYYGYLWSEVLDSDAFDAWLESGDVYNKEVAARFRDNCLAPGGIDDGMTMYKRFRGKEPQIDALLRNRGLAEPK